MYESDTCIPKHTQLNFMYLKAKITVYSRI